MSRARSDLEGSRFGRVTIVDETGSTNDDLARAARSGAGEQVLVADHQRAGRGRAGRVWEAPAGASLLCSFLVHPALTLADAHLVTTALGLAALDAVESVCGVHLGLKWPNDLVAVDPQHRDRKVAGVLAESILGADRVKSVVAGIGLNVNWPPVLPDELAEISTSLRHLAGDRVDRTSLLVALALGFDRRLSEAESSDGRARMRVAALERSATVGRDVRVVFTGRELRGRAVDLTDEGLIVIEDEARVRHQIAVGDIVHLRPLGT